MAEKSIAEQKEEFSYSYYRTIEQFDKDKKWSDCHNDMIYTFSSVISKWDCKDIIHGVAAQWETPTIRDNGKDIYDPEVRKCQMKFCDQSKVPYGRVITRCMEKVAPEMGIDVGPHTDIDMQLTKYEPGDFHSWHIDEEIDFKKWNEEHENWDPEYGNKIRKITGILQLSDPTSYEGGDLMLKSNAVISHKQGDLIVFPSFLEHQVAKVTGGTRFSLVLWHKGPRWK